jgi:hypothetical protein
MRLLKLGVILMQDPGANLIRSSVEGRPVVLMGIIVVTILCLHITFFVDLVKDYIQSHHLLVESKWSLIHCCDVLVA